MKTYIICTSPPGKAVSDYFFLIAKKICENGNKVVVITDGNKPERLPSNTENETFLSWPSKRPTSFKDFIFFYKVCRKYKPDITLGQFGSANIVAIASRLSGVKNVFCYWHTKAEQLFADSKHSAAKIRFQVWRKNIILNLFFTKILTNSSDTKKSLIDFFDVRPGRIFLMPLLIPDFFKDKNIGSDTASRNKISFVARLDKSKGHEMVMKDLQKIVAAYPQLIIYFIGDGPEKERLQSIASSLNISDNIIFTGNISLSEVYNYMSASLIHISASRDEAFGLVNVEALSAGTPILAPEVGGIKEILMDGYNGFFYKPAKKEDLFEKVQDILNGDWKKISENARQSFIQYFSASAENIAKQVTSIEQLVS